MFLIIGRDCNECHFNTPPRMMTSAFLLGQATFLQDARWKQSLNGKAP
jgi:hypothetical protein